ncbi:MAG: pyrroline-5-carboxylate reductase [Eubacteriales bacterium]|nr:pyrroline-5-carboxylate reductase [Eubacteriales bacterium]MDD4389521.1 pyrroline-5-carboxylate reductase [Eubacteriales bacterium]
MKYGFIGAGNMGGAILRGALKAGVFKAADVNVFDADKVKLSELEKSLGINVSDNIAQTVASSDVIILAVKPQIFELVLPEAAASITEDKIVISMAAGVSINYIENMLGDSSKVIRIMPNTPAQVGLSMTAVSRNVNITDEDMAVAWEIFKGIGFAEEIDESLMDCVIGTSGSSPAFTYMYIESLVNAAVEHGMEYEKAVKFVCRSVIGAAEMVLQSDIDIEQLRINVCSPGGTTIEGVNALFDAGFGDIVKSAFRASAEKSKSMTK